MVRTTNKQLGEVNKIIELYEVIIPIINTHKESSRLSHLLESWQRGIVKLKEQLKQDVSTKELGFMLRGLKQGLRETPELLKRILGEEKSAALLHEIEIKVGSIF